MGYILYSGHEELMTNGVNNQVKKRGGYMKTKVPYSSASHKRVILCMPCFEARHTGCTGFQTFMPKDTEHKCDCKCRYVKQK